MKLKPKQLEALVTERAAINARLGEIAAAINTHYSALATECAAKRAAKPRAEPRGAVSDPRVAIVRQYVREHIKGAQVFNNRRVNGRTVKVWRALAPAAFKQHSAALQQLLPSATIKAGLTPQYYGSRGGRTLIVVLND